MILEVRDSLLDRQRLGHHPYGVLLSANAEVPSEQWRAEHNARIVEQASGRGLAVVGASADLVELEGVVERGALEGPPTTGAALLHDPWLGYVAARARRCDVLHVNWRDYHVRAEGDALAWTDLRRSRPTLVDVLAGSGWDLGDCPHHHVPALFIREDR
ncbi:hypothetical protein [Kribbella deserti]|uniref:Uncharacterized protein n=1 Tax=Kribbella deserti TaxID=1926257 RepID=A0ABV6QHP9_9ACTN